MIWSKKNCVETSRRLNLFLTFQTTKIVIDFIGRKGFKKYEAIIFSAKSCFTIIISLHVSHCFIITSKTCFIGFSVLICAFRSFLPLPEQSHVCSLTTLQDCDHELRCRFCLNGNLRHHVRYDFKNSLIRLLILLSLYHFLVHWKSSLRLLILFS